MPDPNEEATQSTASLMREAFDAVGPFIERHTSALCPSCEKVCCIDRHGAYEAEDIIFLNAVGAGQSDVMPKKDDTEPCRFLTPEGCGLPRWRRPFRCTWYFCAALLEAMPREDPKGYRHFVDGLRRLQELRRYLLASHSSGRR